MLKKNAIASAVSLSLTAIGGSFVTAPEAEAAGFIEDSTLAGGIYYWQRERERRNTDPTSPHYDTYTTNLSHSTMNLNLDYASGYVEDMLGLDLGIYGAIELAESQDSAHPNEIAFSKSDRTYDENWSGDKSGLSFYKAALKFKRGPAWARAGYIQPTGQTLLAPHWSFLPGTYRGAEAGANFDFGDSGALAFSYMWADQYKAPWHTEMDGFRRNDRITGVNYLHSIGARYDFKNRLVLEAAVGQAHRYTNQYFAKSRYALDVAGSPLSMSYQFYGTQDRIGDHGVNDIYDGLAWLQAATLGYKYGQLDFRFEGTIVKATGNQGFFLQRMTPTYASSNGRLDIWWDNRSDFNANGERTLFASVMYDLSKLKLPGLSVGASAAQGWNAKPSTNPTYDQSQRLSESAWSLDAVYTVPDGRAKGTVLKLHYTRYDNHSNNPSWSNGYANMFQDERDVKFYVIAPLSVF